MSLFYNLLFYILLFYFQQRPTRDDRKLFLQIQHVDTDFNLRHWRKLDATFKLEEVRISECR